MKIKVIETFGGPAGRTFTIERVRKEGLAGRVRVGDPGGDDVLEGMGGMGGMGGMVLDGSGGAGDDGVAGSDVMGAGLDQYGLPGMLGEVHRHSLEESDRIKKCTVEREGIKRQKEMKKVQVSCCSPCFKLFRLVVAGGNDHGACSWSCFLGVGGDLHTCRSMGCTSQRAVRPSIPCVVLLSYYVIGVRSFPTSRVAVLFCGTSSLIFLVARVSFYTYVQKLNVFSNLTIAYRLQSLIFSISIVSSLIFSISNLSLSDPSICVFCYHYHYHLSCFYHRPNSFLSAHHKNLEMSDPSPPHLPSHAGKAPGQRQQKTYPKKASGQALQTVKRHSKPNELKLFGSCFWSVNYLPPYFLSHRVN